MAAPGGPSAQPQDPYGPVVDELLAELVVEATGTSENKEQVGTVQRGVGRVRDLVFLLILIFNMRPHAS